jgi:precorrin-2 dehydrogenase/sirohydrochlorin ferrochelatase
MQEMQESRGGYHPGYPLFLDMRNRRVVVIGAGKVAERKVDTLLSYGADIAVISPEATPCIRRWADDSLVSLEERAYREGDLAGASIVFCACGDPAVEEQVYAESHCEGCLVNVVDVPPLCDFIVPSIVERGPLRIAVSTSGTAPTEAKTIRHRLEARFDASWAPYLELMGEVRSLVKDRIPGADSVRRPIYEAAGSAGWRERLAAGESISAEKAYREAVAAASKEAC